MWRSWRCNSNSVPAKNNVFYATLRVCMCFRASQKNDFRRFLPFSGDFHKPSMSISKFFISCFTDHPDTPACGRFLLKLSTWLYTNQWFLGGKPVGNARIAGGWIVDYPHGFVDNFFKATRLWITRWFVHTSSKSYPQAMRCCEPLQNVGSEHLPTLSTGLIMTNVGCYKKFIIVVISGEFPTLRQTPTVSLEWLMDRTKRGN